MSLLVKRKAFLMAGAAARNSPYVWRYARHAKRARYMYNIGKAAAPYARAAISAWRSRKKRRFKVRARNFIGPRPGSSSAKMSKVTSSLASKDTRTLYTVNLSQIPKTSINNIHSRQRDIVNLRGIKVCMELGNKGTATNATLAMNVAVLVPKEGDSIGTDDFFRSQGEAASRSVNFSNGLTSNEFHCLPINRDKYAILKHSRFRVPPDLVQNGGRNYTTKNFYIPIKRQMSFDDGAGTSRKDVYLVYWCDLLLNGSGNVPLLGLFDTQIRSVAYFREPK